MNIEVWYCFLISACLCGSNNDMGSLIARKIIFLFSFFGVDLGDANVRMRLESLFFACGAHSIRVRTRSGNFQQSKKLYPTHHS